MGTRTSSIAGSAGASRATLDADDLAKAIVHSRAEIGGTLDEIQGRINPRALKEELLLQFQEGKKAIKGDLQTEFHEAKAALSAEFLEAKERMIASAKTDISDAKTAFREATIGKVETMVHSTQDSVRSASRSLMTTIKENPVPTALVGIGLIWMFASSRSKHHAGGRVTDGANWMGRDASSAAHAASGALSRATHAAGETIEGAASKVKASASEAARGATRGISDFAEEAGATGRRLGHRAESLFEERPVAVGAAILVAGALVGMAIPITRKETEWMGDARHTLSERAGRLVDKVGSQLHDGVEKLSRPENFESKSQDHSQSEQL